LDAARQDRRPRPEGAVFVALYVLSAAWMALVTKLDQVRVTILRSCRLTTSIRGYTAPLLRNLETATGC
jgi:hypothetical protein